VAVHLRHRGLFGAWLAALAVSSAATLSLPQAVRTMIDHGFSGGAQINQAFALLFVVAVVLALATAARFYFVSLLGEKVVADLRERLYAHLIGLMQASTTAAAAANWSRACRPTANCCATWSARPCRWPAQQRHGGRQPGDAATSPRLAGFTLLGIPLAVLPIVLGARQLQKIARNSQDRGRRQHAGGRNAGRGTHGAGLCARRLRAQPLRRRTGRGRADRETPHRRAGLVTAWPSCWCSARSSRCCGPARTT
jgi:hypothetical protein